MVWLTRIALLEEMYTRICEENGLQILCPRHCLEMAVASRICGDLDRAERWASVAADNLRSYVRDSDPMQYWEEGCRPASNTMAAIIWKTESEDKAALYQEGRGC
jgi:hypothetical protein